MTLAEFLREWLNWVERGAPDGLPYHRSGGLCSASKHHDHDLYFVLKEAFITDGLNSAFPFGTRAYWKAKENRTMHRGRKRIAWVRNTLALLESQETILC
jgi:hypothetical protein